MKIEMYVKLLIPDTTAVTAFKALKRIGYDISKLDRFEYYSFEIEGDESAFKEKISAFIRKKWEDHKDRS